MLLILQRRSSKTNICLPSYFCFHTPLRKFLFSLDWGTREKGRKFESTRVPFSSKGGEEKEGHFPIVGRREEMKTDRLNALEEEGSPLSPPPPQVRGRRRKKRNQCQWEEILPLLLSAPVCTYARRRKGRTFVVCVRRVGMGSLGIALSSPITPSHRRCDYNKLIQLG